MKDHLRELVDRSATTAQATLIVREYLQARILEALGLAGGFQTWAFLGGTALRFLYRIRRFSEDLDFSRTTADPARTIATPEFERLVAKVRKQFEAEAYLVDVRARSDAVVQSAFVGFPGLLHELGLSPNVGQKVSIKIEVDTNPPPHAVTQASAVRRHVLLNLLHYDRASLFAGKLHALIERPYVKGRDVYDLLWYLSDPTWPEPNLALLRASLAQTGTDLTDERVADWRTLVAKRIGAMDWDRVIADVAPFLEQPREIEILTRDTILALLRR